MAHLTKLQLEGFAQEAGYTLLTTSQLHFMDSLNHFTHLPNVDSLIIEVKELRINVKTIKEEVKATRLKVLMSVSASAYLLYILPLRLGDMLSVTLL